MTSDEDDGMCYCMGPDVRCANCEMDRDVVIARCVEVAAQIISGKDFPDGESLFKARQIADLFLNQLDFPTMEAA